MLVLGLSTKKAISRCSRTASQWSESLGWKEGRKWAEWGRGGREDQAHEGGGMAATSSAKSFAPSQVHSLTYVFLVLCPLKRGCRAKEMHWHHSNIP